MKIASGDASRSTELGGATSTQARFNDNRIKNPVGVEAKEVREEKRIDGCVVLLGTRHEGRPEAENTFKLISHRVEISIARGGADEKDDWKKGGSFVPVSFSFFYHVFVA